jgi:hypothetical protein
VRYVAPLSIFLILLCGSFEAHSGAAQCSPKAGEQRVDRAAYEKLQLFVNDGHQPWRLDGPAVVREKLFEIEDGLKERDVFNVPLKSIRVTQTREVWEYVTDHQLCYRITVQRFSWLLPLAKKWEWMVWAPTDVSCKVCQTLPK